MLAGLALLALGGTATAEMVTRADFRMLTTQHLYNLCAASKDDPYRDRAVYFCFGFFTGAAHYHRALGSGQGTIVCPPNNRRISRLEAVRVFLAWAQGNRQHMAEKPIDGVVRALVAKWPCPAKKAGAAKKATPKQ